MSPNSLRVLTTDDWPLFRSLRLRALAEAPYAFGSRLDDWQGAGDAEHRWRQRLSDVPYNVVAYLDGVACGMISATKPDPLGAVELISMWVDPFARGTGVADALVHAAIGWARTQKAAKISLDVREDNQRARRFYRRLGFEDCGPIESAPHSPPERRMQRMDGR